MLFACVSCSFDNSECSLYLNLGEVSYNTSWDRFDWSEYDWWPLTILYLDSCTFFRGSLGGFSIIISLNNMLSTSLAFSNSSVTSITQIFDLLKLSHVLHYLSSFGFLFLFLLCLFSNSQSSNSLILSSAWSILLLITSITFLNNYCAFQLKDLCFTLFNCFHLSIKIC